MAASDWCAATDEAGFARMLAEDRKDRRKANEHEEVGSVRVKDLRDLPPAHWEGFLPTVLGGPRQYCSAVNAWERIGRWTDGLLNVPLIVNDPSGPDDVPHFVVAGGAADLASRGHPANDWRRPADIDLFYVGPADTATEHLEKLFSQIHRQRLCVRLKDALEAFRDSLFNIEPQHLEVMGLSKQELLRGYDLTGNLMEMAQYLIPKGTSSPYTELITRKWRGKHWFYADGRVLKFTRPGGVPVMVWEELYCKKVFCPVDFAACTYSALRTKHAITLVPDGLDVPKIQVILRAYERPEYITLGFDLGSSAIAIDWSTGVPQYQLSRMGQFAHTTGYNVVDPTRLSRSFIWRLDKYWRRGYGFILPHLDLSKVEDDASDFRPRHVDLPLLSLRISYASGNFMTACILYPQDGGPPRVETDYTFGEDLNKYMVQYQNVKTLTEGGDDYVYMVSDEHNEGDRSIGAILRVAPLMDPGYIQTYFADLTKRIWDGERLNFRLLKACVGAPPAPNPHAQYWARPAQPPPDLPTMTVAEFIDLEEAERGGGLRRLKALLAARRAAVLHLANRVERAPLEWMDEHPASQYTLLYTGSHHPFLFGTPQESARQTYGDYYRPLAGEADE